MLFHPTTIFTLAHLLLLSLAHLPQKHHLNLLSSITKALLTHTLASFWRKQSCNSLECDSTRVSFGWLVTRVVRCVCFPHADSGVARFFVRGVYASEFFRYVLQSLCILLLNHEGSTFYHVCPATFYISIFLSFQILVSIYSVKNFRSINVFRK